MTGEETAGALAPAASELDLAAYISPPADLPSVSVGPVKLTPIAYVWRVDGSLMQASPNEDDDIRPMPVHSSDRLNLTISTSVLPTTARLVIYNDPPAAGPPDPDRAIHVDCRKDVDCAMSNAEGIVLISYQGEVSNRAIVGLSLAYATLEPSDEKIGLGAYTASWLARVTP